MAFWSDAKSSPLKNYRFKVQGLLKNQWLVKSVSVPSFEVGQSSHQLLNHVAKVAGVLNWQDITITTVADGATLNELNSLMKSGGQDLTAYPLQNKGITSSFNGPLKNKIIIDMLDADGKSVSGFEVRDWFIVGISFSTLDYSDDELFNIEVSIAYEYALIT